MRRRASALLIAMLVISIVGMVGFGMVHLAFRELRINNNVAASPRAYEAAQAGIEFALLQYRYNKDYDFSGLGDKSIQVDDTASFKLKMSRQTTMVGDPSWFGLYDGTTEASLTNFIKNKPIAGVLSAGEEISIKRPAPGHLYLHALVVGDPANIQGGLPTTSLSSSTDDGVLVITAYNDINSSEPSGQYSYVLTGADWNGFRTDSGTLQEVASQFTMAKRLTFRFLYPKAMQDAATGTASAKLYFALFSNETTSTDPLGIQHQPLSTDRTIIESIGLADGVQRRLEAVLNNRTNQLVSVYDYSNPTSGMVDYTIYGTNLITN